MAERWVYLQCGAVINGREVGIPAVWGVINGREVGIPAVWGCHQWQRGRYTCSVGVSSMAERWVYLQCGVSSMAER